LSVITLFLYCLNQDFILIILIILIENLLFVNQIHPRLNDLVGQEINKDKIVVQTYSSVQVCPMQHTNLTRVGGDATMLIIATLPGTIKYTITNPSGVLRSDAMA
jgi:hypothetical protein